MKSTQRKFKKQQAGCLTLIALLFSTLASGAQSTSEPSSCGELEPGASKNSGSAEFVVKSQIQAVPKLFEHECFKTRSIVKASVDYFKAGDEARKISYEDIWFHEGKALGMERKTALGLPPGKTVDIEIKGSPCPSYLENKAAAGTILRLLLDLKINHDQIKQVTVPFNAFSDISSALQNRDFHQVSPGQEPPPEATIVLNLQADYGTAKQTLYYSKQ